MLYCFFFYLKKKKNKKTFQSSIPAKVNPIYALNVRTSRPFLQFPLQNSGLSVHSRKAYKVEIPLNHGRFNVVSTWNAPPPPNMILRKNKVDTRENNKTNKNLIKDFLLL